MKFSLKKNYSLKMKTFLLKVVVKKLFMIKKLFAILIEKEILIIIIINCLFKFK